METSKSASTKAKEAAPSENSTSSSLKTENGIIAVFDILGYQNFVDNNSVAEAAEIVLKAISSLDEEVPGLAAKTFYKENEVIKTIIGRIKSLVLSDTIIVRLAYDKTIEMGTLPPTETRKTELKVDTFPLGTWTAFLVYCAVLAKQMFLFGLPVRGVINEGDYYVEKNCLFGRPMMDAYRRMQQLDIAACVLSKEAGEHWKELSAPLKDTPEALTNFLGDFYLIPLKDGEEINLYSVNFSIRKSNQPDLLAGDLRQRTFETFWAHRKDVAQSVMQKAHNTEKLLRFFKMKFPKPLG